MQENILDLIEIYFGSEKTTARPFKFHEDDKGNLIEPKKAITSCPNCGHGNEIDLDNFFPGEKIVIQCPECGFGFYESDIIENNNDVPLDANQSTVSIDYAELEKDILSALSDDKESISIENKYNNNIVIDESEDVQSLKLDHPFIDPIEMGTFVIDEI